MPTFHFFNPYHYGDNILNLKFFYNHDSILRECDITIHYYYDTRYNSNTVELLRYVKPETVHLHDLSKRPADAIRLWMGDKINDITYYSFETYYNMFYRRIGNILGIPLVRLNTSLWQQEDYLLELYDKLDDKYKNVDVLIINAKPFSAQCRDMSADLQYLAEFLVKKGYKVITTSPTTNSSIPATMNDGLTMQDIGAISTHCKYVVSVFTGPLNPLFNTYTRASVQKWFMITMMGVEFLFSGINNTFMYDANISPIFEYFLRQNSVQTLT